MTQWMAAFHIFVANFCERYPMEASNLLKYAHWMGTIGVADHQ
jgi:hypothetical protein